MTTGRTQFAALRALAALLLACAAPVAATADAEGGSVRVEAYARPGRIYAGQPFEILVEITLPRQVQLGVSPPTGLPEAVKLGEPTVQAPEPRATADGGGEYVLSVAFPALCGMPLKCLPERSLITLQYMVRSFFGHPVPQKERFPVTWRPFEILPLPEEGRPADFGGAVGSFTLKSSLAPAALAPGDVARLTVSLSGEGALNGARLSPPALPPALFKAYPPEALPPQPGELARVASSVVPLSTQAVEIAAATFSYFDPASRSYRTARSRPVRLTFVARAAPSEPAVRTIDLSGQGGEAVSAGVEAGAAIQLHLAPSETSLKTFAVPADEPLTTLGETPDGLWRRVRVRATGRTGWMRGDVPDKGTP